MKAEKSKPYKEHFLAATNAYEAVSFILFCREKERVKKKERKKKSKVNRYSYSSFSNQHSFHYQLPMHSSVGNMIYKTLFLFFI